MTIKRLFDIAMSAAGLIITFPVFVVISLAVMIESGLPVFFTQERIGRYFRKFRIIKFRSMRPDASGRGPSVTVEGDPRVTRVGAFLRRTKLDELPQLINVLKGEMSIVGPRPEVEKYVTLFREDYELLLRVRPGITDPSSLEYYDEERRLSRSDEWEKEYTGRVLPDKIRLSLDYIGKRTMLSDLKIILRTVLGR